MNTRKEPHNELALFAGGGGGLLASKLLGWNTVGAVEIEEYPREVLLQRQRDGMLDQFPIWDDVRTFDGKPWRGLVDVISGGFPCQDISAAGKGDGLAGERSGLWFEYLRIIEEIRPETVFIENSPNLRTRGLGTIIEGLTSLGYDIRWGVLGAWHIGAPHKRNRMWIVAHAGCERHGGQESQVCTGRDSSFNGGIDVSNTNNPIKCTDSRCRRCGKSSRQRDNAGRVYKHVPNTNSSGCKEQRRPITDGAEHAPTQCGGWWESEPRLGREVDGLAEGMDKPRANVQV